MAGSSDGAAAAPNALGLALTILQALSVSQLSVEERAAVCAGVLRSLARHPEGPIDLLADVAALSDAEDVQQRVEASWLVLEERLRGAAPAIDESTALEARRWIEGVALPVVRSGRPEVQPACDFIGLNAIGALVRLCGEQGGVRACVEAATLQLLEDVAAGRGTEESPRVLAARMRWIASFLTASGEAGLVPLPVVQEFFSIVRHHTLPSMRATAILGICPALVEILRRDSALCMEAWGLIVELDGLGLLDHQRDAFAMLCVLYDCIRPLLAPQDREELWRLLARGLTCEGCSAVRKRSLFILGQELELAGASDARAHPTTVWWTRFLSAYDTLENVLETHLLQQVFPIVLALVEEAFGAEQEGGAAAQNDGPLPAPSVPWAELLLQRVFNGPNYAVQRVYLRWFFAQSRAEPAGEGEPQVVLDVNRLSETFVLATLLPGLKGLGNLREEREALLDDIARFLAAYIVGRQEQEGAEGCRRFLRALLAYARDGTKSSPVRMALLAFVEQHDVLARARPCLGTPELDLARSALAAFLKENNQAVGHRLADGVLACCERFTDRGAVAAALGGAESVRALLLDLPLKLSLHAWRERIGRWLGALGGGGEEGGGDELAWWRASTARGVEALLSTPDSGNGTAEDETSTSSSSTSFSSSCALACFFLRTPDDMHAALAPCLHVLERLRSHPYLPPHTQRAALTLLRHLAVLLRQAPHAALGDILRPCLGEPIEFLVAAIAAAMGDDSSTDGAGEALFRFHVDVLGASMGLAAQLGFTVGSSVVGLVETCASTIGGDDAASSTVAGRRAVLVLRSLLESLVQNDGRPGSAPALALAIGERFDSLKQCLDAAATRRPPTIMAGFSEYVSNVWRCRALLFRLQGLPSLRQRLHIAEELELLLGAIDTVGKGSLQDVLVCLKCSVAPYVLSAPDAAGWYTRLSPIVGVLLRCMDETNYTRGIASLCIDMVLDAPFLTHAALCQDADGPVRRFFARLVRVSTTKKAYLLVDVAARLVAVLRRMAQQQQPAPSSSSSSPPPALCFVEELVQLLTMREQDVSIQHRADDGEEAPDALLSAALEEQKQEEEDEEGQEKGPETFPFVRMTVLSFLTDLFRDAAQQPVLDRLLLALFDRAAAAHTRKTQIAGSTAYSAKLRAWQALAVLAPFVHASILPEINARLYEAMHVVTLPQIRWHMEMFTAYLCMRYPSVGVPLLVERIRTVDLRPQVSASLVVVVGMLCLTKETLFEEGGQLPDAFVLPVLKAVLPWLSGTHVTTRVICQMVAFRLLSRARAAGLLASGGLDEAYLNGTLDFLEGNREMSILRGKELRRFEAVSVPRSCSVAGVMGHAFVEGEFTATHLEITLRESMTELIRQMEAEDLYPTIAPRQAKRDLFVLHSDVSSARSLLERTGADATYAIQKKIVVSDVLQGLSREEPKRFENARGEPLQDIVICASLLDRLPNLAGLARTCEIFAARTLAIPDLRVTKEAMFQSISSSAERWVPMVQVKDTEARDYLRRMKWDGYTVVGLEQTSTSRCLTRVELPRRMLLLLGREKEGVPVELLAEVDVLVEIPQMGLVRSLNVHVSASLILWEYTRQHRFAGPVGCGTG